MSTELIINATLPETRIALLENSEIQELHIERDSERGIVGNIYKGKVIRVLPGMQAAFVDIGLEKAAFLYVDDIFFPDMKTPLTTQPLPEAPITVPQGEQGGESTGRGGRERGRHGRRGRGRHARGGQQGSSEANKTEAAPLPNVPVSPEDHARLQMEYAKQMLDVEEEAAENGKPIAAGPVAETVAAGANPEDMALEQPEARSPVGAEFPDESDRHQMELAAAEAEDFEDEEAVEADTPIVYRSEPEIDPEAWVEDIAEVKSGIDVATGDTIAPVADEGAEPVASLEVAAAEATGSVVAEHAAETAADGESADKSSLPTVVPVEARGPAPEPVDHDEEPVRDRSGDDDDDDVAEMPRRRRRREQVNISDLVKEGQEILVQVAKDPIGTKGARLTCHVSLPGRYLVFMPTVDHIGVSRRIDSEGERRRLKETISRIRPAKTGVIVRTASGKQTDKKLKADLDYLVATWNDIQKKFNKQRTPSPVYQDLTIVLRAIRDMFTDEVDKVIVDSKREHKAIMKFVTRFIPHVKDKIDLYEGDVPIFDYYGIEQEISRSLERKVWLKSGGYLVVDQAEALVAIDVNTGRYVGKKTLEETILKTNLEAVKEIAYQLRLRNCGGIIILDLIDMEKEANKEKVYKALEEALKKDRARPTIMKISQLGLIEMTRKRTRDSLVRSLCEPCTYCEGKGYVKNKLTIAYDIMRDLEREGAEKDTNAISIQCHPTVADVLLEDKRDVLEDLEHQFNKKITIRGNGAYHVEQYELVAHRESKNMVWSSEERRQLVRQKAQERAQSLAAEQRKKEQEERDRRRKEQEEARQKQQAEREERRKQIQALREQRKQQLDELRAKKQAEADARRAQLIAEGANPDELPVEAVTVSESELEPLIGPDGKAIIVGNYGANASGESAESDEGDERRGRRRRRRGRRGRGRRERGEQRPQGAPNLPKPLNGGSAPGPDEGAYAAPGSVSGEHLSASDLAGGLGNEGADEGENFSGNEDAADASQGEAQEGRPSGKASGGAGQPPGGPRRRRRGRRGGRRHRFRRKPQGGAGANTASSGEGAGGSEGGAPSHSMNAAPAAHSGHGNNGDQSGGGDHGGQ